MRKYKFYFLFLALLIVNFTEAQTATLTYAEKLGFPKGTIVLIIHVDDADMSHDSNAGAIEALTRGAANSTSVIMPCPWVSEFVHFLKQHPNIDAGLHLTLTSEWKEYRWGPLSGNTVTPGLVDGEGCLWRSNTNVVKHASADEVEKEIRAQLDRVRSMGFEPTHLDSHMGTLFASPEFLKRYMKVGMENHIPVMLPGGHDKLIKEDMNRPDTADLVKQMRSLGIRLWNAGLPVLDDLHNFSYGWKIPDSIANDDAKLRDFKTEKYIAALKLLQSGVTMMIMHCTEPSETFEYISDSGPLRKSDLLAMLNPEFKQDLKDSGIVLTTWGELMERRKKVK